MFEDLPARLHEVHDRIARAARSAGRAPEEITLVAVTKSHPVEAMLAARAAGLRELGENRVQEALPKLPRLDAEARVHLIGRLQTNKVNKAVGAFASIMTVDRIELLERIARRADELGIRQPVWVQVNASDEPQKGGCEPAEAADLWARALDHPALRVLGLMTMARYEAPETELRATFASLRHLAEGLRPDRDLARIELSMGMSDDFEVAIEEGATWVRVGTALFGPRDVAPAPLTDWGLDRNRPPGA